MSLPSTQPLDGEFWYVLDDQNDVVWKPRPRVRGDFYLGWLGQNKNVVGAGIVRLAQGQLIDICTHGTPYYWFQPYEVLPKTCEVLRARQISGAEEMNLDFSLAGWGMRDQSSAPTQSLPEAPVASEVIRPLLVRAVTTIVTNFRSEGEAPPPPPPPKVGGLLARTMAPTSPPDPLELLLDRLKEELTEPNVVPTLIELAACDVNVLPGYRQSSLFETLQSDEQLPPPSKLARLAVSAIYHLAPLIASQRLRIALLLNSLRQRHPFDVTWGADFLVKSFGISSLVKLLQAAVVKERDDQIRGNVLDLLQELGYGFSAGLGDEVMDTLEGLLNRQDLGGFAQVVASHLTFARTFSQQQAAALS